MEKSHNIRMKGFQQRTSVEAFFDIIKEKCTLNEWEVVPTSKCVGRVLAEYLISPVNIPGFERSAMDGYALKGEETFGADSYNPLSFTILGQITPGDQFAGEVCSGEAVRIMTGAPLPSGANAVVMAEYTNEVDGQVEVTAPVAPKKNVGKVGEDIKRGETLFLNSRKLRPQDAAVITSIGITEVKVIKKPTIDLLITGNEILKPGSKPSGVKIVDANSVILSSMVQRDQGEIRCINYLKDDKNLIQDTIKSSTADIICISGGASVGAEDYAALIVEELGEILVHGVSMRPSSPTGLGLIDGKKVFLLPGNPVSFMVAYDFFVRTAICLMGGVRTDWPYPKRKIELATKISSQTGRTDYVRIKIKDNKAYLLSTSGASILSSTTRADGFLITREESEGYAEGEVVEIRLYDN